MSEPHIPTYAERLEMLSTMGTKMCRDFMFCGQKCIYSKCYTYTCEVRCQFSNTPNEKVPLIEVQIDDETNNCH